MTAQPKPSLHKATLPDDIRHEIARLKGAGFYPLPLGGGDAGKAPLIRRWTDPKLTLAQIMAPMFRTGSAVYGLRLEGLAVIDCDVDSADLVVVMEARFGPSPVNVKTPRGRHLYYRAAGSVPNLRGEGLPVDIKTGGRSYVVGPLSQRPDGGVYAPCQGIAGAGQPAKPAGSGATALIVLLTDLHGHVPGKRFALDHEAMRAAGLTDLSPRAFRSARRMLETAGLLQLVGKHRAGSHCQSFTLTRCRPSLSDVDNVVTMPTPDPGNLRDLQATDPRPKHKAFKACEPGYLHVDVKDLPQMADETSRRYLFVAIDPLPDR